MRTLPIGIYEKALPFDVDWYERLSVASEVGFDFVEISIDESEERRARLDWSGREKADLRHAVAQTGMPLTTLCLSAHRKFAFGSNDPEIRAEADRIMRKAIEFAVDVGVRVIQLAGYYVYYEPHVDGSYARFRAGLGRALEWASHAGVILALENVDGPDILSVTKAMEFVTAFNSPYFQIYPDIGNLAEHELDVCAELEAGRGHFVGVHVKDTLPGEPRRVPFGEGVTPFVDAFATLAHIGFSGPVLLEMWNDDSPDSLQIVRDARQWVMARMAEGGLIDDEI